VVTAGNASAFINFEVTGPDLIVTDMNIPATANRGGSFLVEFTVKNQGTGVADRLPSNSLKSTFLVNFYLLNNVTGISIGGYYSFDTLEPGKTIAGVAFLYVPTSVPAGVYSIKAVVDDQGRISETDETNNSTLSSTMLSIVTPDIDILPVSVDGPDIATAGDTITVTHSLKNQGSETSGYLEFYFYLSSDTVIDTSDIWLDANFVEGILGGTISTANTKIWLPSWISGGAYYIGVIIDPYNFAAETDKTNNVLYDPVPINIIGTSGGSGGGVPLGMKY
jgi:subtilase family serine protease